jgi:hypothetical protein
VLRDAQTAADANDLEARDDSVDVAAVDVQPFRDVGR